MKIVFPHSQFCVNEDGSGATFIPGLGMLPFSRPTSDDSTILGAPFAQKTNIGYKPSNRHLANAEHEALHLWLMERCLHRASPNHCELMRDIHSKNLLVWRTREELLVVGVQWAFNTGEITFCFKWVCAEVFNVDCEQFLEEALRMARIFRAAFEAVIKVEVSDNKCSFDKRLC